MRFLISTRAWRSTTPGPTGSRTRRSTTKRCAGRWRPCWSSSATSSVTRRCSGPIVTSGSAQTRELVPQTGDGQRVDTLTTLLTAITGRRYGLPQQNHTSDVLAEAYVLERRLHRANARVWRYSDDFRIATDSWSDALATVDLLEREVRRIGLTLNDSKTVIRRGDTYEASLKRREVLLKQVADEADLDLTGVRLARGYDQGNDDEPEQDPVTSASESTDRRLRTVGISWVR